MQLFNRVVIGSVLIAAWAPAAGAEETPRPKNLIVMLADGAGYNTLQATRLWTGVPLTADGAEFHQVAVATYGLRRGRTPRDMTGNPLEPLEQDPHLVYDPAAAWDTTAIEGQSKVSDKYDAGFAGYEWHRRTCPDSANTMSALMTGVRSYNGAINVDGAQQPVTSIAEIAHQRGKRTGVVSTVPFCHATPASGGGAHNISRNNYHELAMELFGSGVLDVIAGGGNPMFDDNGIAAGEAGYDGPEDPYEFMPRPLWQDLKNRTNHSGANGVAWTLVSDKAAIEAIADGSMPAPDKLAMIPQVARTLQFYRNDPSDQRRPTYAPGAVPLLTNAPDLTTMAQAALRVVESDEDGFFLMIEGGAVDWAMHGNDLGRMIEEYQDFDAAVASVVAYLEDESNAANFGNTLLIITADHDHLLYGPDSTTTPFEALVDNGAGILPGYKWQFGSHSNWPVPLFARGVGAEALVALAEKVDAHTDAEGRQFGLGPYTTQADVGAYLIELMSE